MPNIASILKSEIARVARKEIRSEIEALRKSSVAYRSAIAALRRQVTALEGELRRFAADSPARVSGAKQGGGETAGVKRRFSASRLAAHRSKLGLSAATYGRLVGVSGQTI
jgi:hypothetical protein